MFSREEAKKKTKLFWTSFGKYMGKHTSQQGKHLKWINYKTYVKDVYFRSKVDSKKAYIGIELQHPDEGIRHLFYDQFCELRNVFNSICGEWIWDKDVYDEHGNKISRIYKEIKGVNIYLQDTWHDIFPFLEENLLNLDEFWADFNEIFKQLED